MWWTPTCWSTPWTAGSRRSVSVPGEVLRLVGGAGTAALPAQVLSEFANACLRKLEPRPDPTTVRQEVERLMLAFPVLPLTGPVVLEALRGVGEHMLSYYDAQIWASSVSGRWPWS